MLLALSSPARAAPEDAPKVRAALAALARTGAQGPDGAPLFPADLSIVEQADGRVVVEGSFAAPAALHAEVIEELRREALGGALAAFGVQDGLQLLVRRDGRLLPYGIEPRELPAPRTRLAPRIDGPRPRATPRLPLGGALLGRRVALVAGHGWLDDGAGGWRTQRSRWSFTGCGNCRGILEDFFTAEVVTNQLLPLLQGMGAEVVLVREPDHGGDGVILDDGDPDVIETGAWRAGTNPGGYGDDYRVLDPGAEGSVRYELPVTDVGEQRLSLRFVAGENRTPAALVEIAHVGGTTLVDLDQRVPTGAWLDLGSWLFAPGAASVTLRNGSADGFLIADAVKLGGGTWASSGKPWWEMGAVSYVPWAGADANVTQYGDVSIRPAYAEYVGAEAYISVHANASGVDGGSAANGLSTYRYSCATYGDHSTSAAATGCDDPPGSTRLIDLVHGAVLSRLRSDFDPNFGDRGRRVANFGELRTLDDMPGVLLETGFFDNLASPSGSPAPRYPDNRALHDPRWREAFAYGVAEGLAQFLNPGAGAPPVRPEGLIAQNQPDGTLRVRWAATPDAEGYRLYRAREGRGWDAGELVRGTEATIDSLPPGTTLAVRVAALSANGEGLPSQAVTARVRGAIVPAGVSPAELLYVGAYDRRDAWVQDRDNDLQYAIEHGDAIAAALGGALYFDGALDEAVLAGSVTFDAYAAVDYAAGKDSTADAPIPSEMQGLMGVYLANGGKLLISGEEIGYALVETSDDVRDGVFLTETLGVVYLSDDAESYELTGVAGGPFEAISSARIDDGTGGVYEVVYPDVLGEGASGGEIVMRYGSGGAAVIAKSNVVFFGTPLEAIVPAPARAQLFDAALRHLLPGVTGGDLDLDGASDACEAQYGYDLLDATDGGSDVDADGATLAQECAAGTDPGPAGGLPVEGSCTDGLDGDANGATDCADDACALDPACSGAGGAGGGGGAGGAGGGGAGGAGGALPTRELACDDRRDDDGDGATDCEDPDCLGAAICDPGAGGSIGGGGAPAARQIEAESGCGCNAGSAGDGVGLAGLLFGLATFARRRGSIAPRT